MPFLLVSMCCTPEYDKVLTTNGKLFVFYITLGIGCVFLLVSITFVATNGETSLNFVIEFRFLTSFMLLLDFFQYSMKKVGKCYKKNPEDTNRTESLIEPLECFKTRGNRYYVW